MKSFRVLVLVVALLAGGAAAYLAMNLQPTLTTEVVELAPQIQTRDVLVAAADIGPGRPLTRENVRWQAWPEGGVNSAFIDRAARPDAVDKLAGSIVRSQFFDGEPIREGKLARAESGFMSAILPSGKRAVAVRVSAQSTAGGFVLPNDRVDMIHTIQQANADGSQQNVSSTLLGNIRVLAVDQTVEEKDGEKVVVGKTVTLELDPAQVEIVTAAEASGTISLSLRSMSDADEEVVAGKVQKQSGTVRIFRSGRSQVVQAK